MIVRPPTSQNWQKNTLALAMVIFFSQFSQFCHVGGLEITILTQEE